ncbi:Flavonol synthase/flavanone 3-hydroxylase [Linum perenne]
MGVTRVQDIASESKETIPDAFIRNEAEQPAITTVQGVTLEVPTIDLADPDREKVHRLIVEASKEWGMFQIVNHDIPTDLIARLQDVGRQFFELPLEEKESYAKLPGSIEGYGTLLQKEIEGKKGWVDHLFHKVWPPAAVDYKFWPRNPASYREVNEEYVKKLHGLVNKLYECLSLGLGLEAGEVKEALGGDDLVYLMKINYYPPCPRPDLALGVVAHTDMSSLTLLVPNDVQGLQASRDGQWYDVRYIPNAIVVHIGDQMEIVSNGFYKGVLHRTTVNKDKTRMSWPVFLEPPTDHAVGPHRKLVGDNNPAKYKTKKYGEYCYCKLNKIPQ